MGTTPDDPRRRVPRTDVVLADPAVRRAAAGVPAAAVKAAVADAQERARSGRIAPEDVVAGVVAALATHTPTTLTPVLNATGVVLHTNIGRAPLSPAAIEAATRAAGYVDVEFDLATGSRARRGRGTLAALLHAVPGAQDALVVNNGAAALVLATTALAVAAGRPEVVMSRGEVVEIGDGFRLHELIASTGARLVEVGTTNRTRAADYAAALGPATGAVLKVHPSNFRVEGFTCAASVAELASVCGESGGTIPLVVDIGSGLLRPDPLLPDEPDATSALAAGADLVTSSGDKLLGGPQAGIVLGRRDRVHALRRHPLARALRVDKITLAALEATLGGGDTPTHDALHAGSDELRRRTTALADHLGVGEVVPTAGRVGGGGAPGLDLPGWGLALPGDLTAALRAGDPPVVARVEKGRTLVDLRCVPTAADRALAAALRAATPTRAS